MKPKQFVVQRQTISKSNIFKYSRDKVTPPPFRNNGFTGQGGHTAERPNSICSYWPWATVAMNCQLDRDSGLFVPEVVGEKGKACYADDEETKCLHRL